VVALPNLEGIAQRLFAVKRFVLLVGDAGAMVARISGASVEAHEFLDAAVGDNVRRAGQILAEFPKLPVVLLFDVLGQSYRRDRLPPVNMLDRPKILARKLESLFAGTELRGGLRLGPAEGDIRGFDYLFAAIAASSEIAQWQALLEQIENPVSDVRLLPVESVKLLQRLANKVNGDGNGAGVKPSHWTILISQHRTGGLRQIVTRDHRLAIARMTAGFVDIDSPGEIASLLQREIGGTIDYITRLGFDRAEGLDAYFIGRSDIGATLKNAQLPVRRLISFTPAEAQSVTGITGAHDESGHFADVLHAAWGGSRFVPALSIWPQKKRQQRMMTVGQKWGARAMAAASVAGLLYGADLTWEMQNAEAAYQQAEASRADLQQRYDAQVSKLDAGPISIARMRDIITLHAQLLAADVDLNQLYAAIDSSLSRDVKLQALDIEVEPPAISLAPSQEQAVAPSSSPEPPPVNAEIVLDLDLSSFRDAELAVGETDRMARALRDALPKMNIKIKRQPLHILPDDTMTVKPGENVLAFSGEDRVAKIVITGRLK
jgi:hypothetical protein